MRALRFNGLVLVGLCILCAILLCVPGQVEAKGRGGPKGGPKKAPASAKSGPKAKPAAKLGRKARPAAKPTAKPARAKKPVGKPLASKRSNRRPLPTKKAISRRPLSRRGTYSYLLPPVYVGQTSPYFRPRIAVPRVIHSTNEHVSIVTSTEPSETGTPTASPKGRPDLAVTEIRAESDGQIDANEKPLQVTAIIENLGGAAFRSDEGAQVLVLYKNGELVAQQDFDTLKTGQTLNLTVDVQPESAVYEARVLFAEDLRQDGNPANDDMNPKNDRLSRELDLSDPAVAGPETETLGSDA